MKKGQVFVWTQDDGVVKRYSIDAALLLILRNQIPAFNALTPDLVAEAHAINSRRAGPLHPEHVAAADLSEPLIVITTNTPDGERQIIIDGWHRVAKAVLTNHTENLSAYFLTAEEAERCRIN